MMLRTQRIGSWFWLLFLLGTVTVGIIELMRLRFESGDIYPAYSSLRSGPLGTKALFEAMNRLDGVNVRRHFQPLEKLRLADENANQDPGRATVFYFALRPRPVFPRPLIESLERLAKAGSRVVISYTPVLSTNAFESDEIRPGPERLGERDRKRRRQSDPDRGELDRDEAPDAEKPIELASHWGLTLRIDGADAIASTRDALVMAHRIPEIDAPPAISWHSALRFQIADDSWRTIYTVASEPVLVERQFGRGTIVLCADSYFLGNEALFHERHANLLAWLAGTATAVVFDENHFGMQEKLGVAALARRYRLHGLAAGLLALAVLFIWRNSSPLVPPYAELETPAGDRLSGKDATAGFVNLLRRNIPPSDIVLIGYEQWKSSRAKHYPESVLSQVQRHIDAERTRPEKNRDPVQLYHALNRLLVTRQGKRNSDSTP